MTSKEQPSDIAIELPILVWGKSICIQMMGNDNWKHYRDYKAIITLTTRWLSLRKDKNLEKLYMKAEDQFLKNGTIDWNILEKIRVIAHNFLREYESGRYNPDSDGMGMITMPEMWVIERIRELTDS